MKTEITKEVIDTVVPVAIECGVTPEELLSILRMLNYDQNEETKLVRAENNQEEAQEKIHTH